MTTREARVWNPDTQQWELVGMAPGPAGPKGDTGPAGPAGPSGTNGKDGAAASIKVGKTETLAPGMPATVKNVGTESAAIFDFGIPKGDPGGGAGDTIPIGSIFPYVGTTAPFGWLMCDGTTVNSSTYPTLAALLAPFGGKTPDLRNRFPMGAGAQALGATGGNSTINTVVAHQHSVTGSVSVTVTQDNGLSVSGSATGGGHSHSGNTNDPGSHFHSYYFELIAGSREQRATGNAYTVESIQKTAQTRTTDPNGSHTHTVSVSGGDHSHPVSGSTGPHSHTASGTLTGASAASTGDATVNILNPFVALNYIIRAA